MRNIRVTLAIFIFLLVLSGVTAFPLRTELAFLIQYKHLFPNSIAQWIEKIYCAIEQTPDLVLYGTDWLAFGHLVIAIFFLPVCLRPIQYKWNVIIAMLACIAVFPLAFICGAIRGIPFFHQLIDCAFGFVGFWPLLYVYKKIQKLEKQKSEFNA